MQRFSERLARAMKVLVRADPDKPMSAFVVALYTFALFLAFVVLMAWVLGTPLSCVLTGANC